MSLTKEYWDACLFIAYLNDKSEEKDKVDIIETLLRNAQRSDSNILIVVSTIVLAEVQPRDDYNPLHYQQIREMFYTARRFIKVQAVTPRIADVASNLRTKNVGIGLADAIHIATAGLEQCYVLYTFNGTSERKRRNDLLSFNGITVAPGLPPLHIKEPTVPPDSQLPLPRT